MANLSRRDFLKLAGYSPVYFSLAKKLNPIKVQGQAKNILFLVYDAWTASNISLYGYARETTPHLAELSKNAIVYHNHHAASDFTSPGTASILTGTLPWTHRAINYAGTVIPNKSENNIFRAMASHHSIAYSHNVLVNEILRQLIGDIDQYIPRAELMLISDWVEKIFHKDFDASTVSRYFIFDPENPFNNSLIIADIINKLTEKLTASKLEGITELFPKGLPEGSSSSSYTLEDSHNWLRKNIDTFPKPFLGYFHFLPPHAPYSTRADFIGRFEDNFKAVEKPPHFFTSHANSGDIPKWRQEYDEFVSYVDEEFAKLFSHLESSGILEDTIVVLTSDHGELFERELVLHGKNVFYESIVKVPLMIFDPDQSGRTDIYDPTSAIDLLPTLMHMADKEVPTWAEGQILPPYKETPVEKDRAIFSLAAVHSKQNAVLDVGTYAIIKNGYKLVFYEGHEELPGNQPFYELFDINNDPDELENLYASKPGLAEELLEQLKAEKDSADDPYK
jgi:arylsulfatase A-like enzyme